MDHKVPCPFCREDNIFSEDPRGARVRCWQCNKFFTVPQPDRPRRPAPDRSAAPRQAAYRPKNDARPWLETVAVLLGLLAGVGGRVGAVFSAVFGFAARHGRMLAPLLLCVAIACIVAGLQLFGGMTEQSQSAELDRYWQNADDYFRRAHFAPAAEAYGKIDSWLAETGLQRPEDRRLAQAMSQWCHELDSMQETFTADGDGLDRALEALDKRHEQLRSVAISAPPAADAEKSDPCGMAFSLEARWDETMVWLSEQTVRVAGSLNVDQPDDKILQRLDKLIAFLQAHGVDTTELAAKSQTVHAELELRRGLESFAQASDLAAEQLDEASITRCGHMWQAIQQRFPSGAKPEIWEQHTTRLKDRIRERMAGASSPKSIEGTVEPTGPRRLSVKTYSATALVVGKPVELPEDVLVFAHVGALMYALSAATGRIQWICHVGRDVEWLPQLAESGGKKLVVYSSETDERQAVTIAVAADGEALWTWKLPPAMRLGGPPVAIGESVCVLAENGELWTLAVADGRPQSYLKFPEPVASPIVIREDRQGALVIGRTLGVYMIDFAPSPRISDVVFPDKSASTLTTRGMWIPPYAVVMENELTDRCNLLVFNKEADGYRQVQKDEIAGRLWQAPAVFGQYFFVVTDSGTQAIFGLDTRRPQRPLYEVLKIDGASRPLVLQPHFVSHADAPFLAFAESSLMRFSVDSTLVARGRKQDTIWTHPLPDGNYVSTQPLQTTERSVVAVAAAPGRQSVRIESVAIDDGSLQWATELGNPVVEMLPSDSPALAESHALMRTEAGQLFVLRAKPPHWESIGLADVSGPHVGWAARSRSLILAVDEGGPKLKRVDARRMPLVVRLTKELSSAISSPLALHEGQLRFRSLVDERSFEVDGVWAAFVDEQETIRLDNLDGGGLDVRYLQLGQSPSRQWWRPAWVAAEALLVASSDGFVARVGLSSDGDSLYALELSHTVQVEHEIAQPVVSSKYVWLVDNQRSCRLLSVDDLRATTALDLGAKASCNLVFDATEGACLGLSDGRLMYLGAREGQLHVEWQATVSNRPIAGLALAGGETQVVALDDSGGLFVLDRRGRILRREALPAPPSTAPLALGSLVLIGTLDGGIESLEVQPTEPRVSHR